MRGLSNGSAQAASAQHGVARDPTILKRGRAMCANREAAIRRVQAPSSG